MEKASSMLQHVFSPVIRCYYWFRATVVFANIFPWTNLCLCKLWHKFIKIRFCVAGFNIQTRNLKEA